MVAINFVTDARVALVWLRTTLGKENAILIQEAVELYKKVNEVMANGHKMGVEETDGNIRSIPASRVAGGSTTAKMPSLNIDVDISSLDDIEGLEELSRALELTKVDAINRSLVVYAYLSKEKMNGSEIVFQDKFDIIKKLKF